jgi:hypothetical protein
VEHNRNCGFTHFFNNLPWSDTASRRRNCLHLSPSVAEFGQEKMPCYMALSPYNHKSGD